MKRIAVYFIIALPQLLMAGQSTAPSTYSGEESRVIKSLSEQEIEALQNGDGMGFAKAAELNHYPGPRYVLDLSDKLGLTASQQSRTRALYEDMRETAIPVGQELLRAEGDLDLLFSHGGVSFVSLEATLNTIGRLRAKLRFIHLEAHLRQINILDSSQVEKYDLLRGYQPHTLHHDSEIHGNN